MVKKLKMKIEDKIDNKPAITYSQYPLPFNELGFRRFEDLCLNVAIQQYKLLDPEHVGRLGADKGIDLKGFIMKRKRKIPIAIQVKNYQKLTGKGLIDALEKFYEKVPNFDGEFWIITSADVSSCAREQFAKKAKEKNIDFKIIDGSTLEANIRSTPNLLKDFFLRPLSSKDQVIEEILELLQTLKDEFLKELDRSFAGNHEFVINQMKKLDEIKNKRVRKLKAKIAILLKNPDISELEKCMRHLIGNYRQSSQMELGKPFFGKDTAVRALSKRDELIEKFISAYESLYDKIKIYL